MIAPTIAKEAFAFPASFAQERLWLLNQIEPGDPAYHISGAVRFKGALNVAALQTSFNELVRRHESLRTTFKAMDGKVMQVISPEGAVNLEVIAASACNGNGTHAEFLGQMSAIAQEPLDLVTGPLLRIVLLKNADDDHTLLLVIHHIISDGWSLMVLIRELMELYRASVSASSPTLPVLAIQYADYTLWQRKSLSKERLQAELSYWRSKLKDSSVLDLPTDYNRPPVQRHIGARESLQLSSSLVAALTELSQREQTTLFMVLLAAFNVLLHRYTGSYDIVVGTPVAGRKRPELESLIGFFLNTLVLRTEIPDNASFLQVLQKVRDVTLDAYTHEDVPFEKILEDINPRRALSHTPLFQVFVNMLALPEPLAIRLPGVAAEIVDVPETSSKFDITLYIYSGRGKIDLALVYNTDLFAHARIAEMLRQFEHLLAQIVERPTEKISYYSLVTSHARPLLPDPRSTLDSRWEGAVHELFRAQAKRSPHQLAVADPHVSWNYEQVEKLSNQVANCLLAGGIQPGNVVAIYAHRSAPLVIALLGIMKAGAAFLMMDPAYPPARLMDYLEIAQPRALLHLQDAGDLPAALDQFLAASSCRRFVLPGSGAQNFGHVFDEFPSTVPTVSVGAEDVAYVSFTSGSTGKPKGVLGRHGPLSHFVPWLVDTFGLDQSDRFSLFSALSHDPLHRDVFTPLMIGASVFIPHPEDWKLADNATDWMRKNQISISHLTPAMAQVLTEDKTGCSLDSLRYVFFVGDALMRRDVLEIYKLAPQATCINYFGSTETQRAVSFLKIPRPANSSITETPLAKDVVPLGHGIKDVQLLVLNQARQLAGIGEAGEIYLRSPHLALGYLGDPELSNQKFLRNWFTDAAGDRLYKTGDLGRYLPDGSVETLGRADAQVKIRGFRIEPGETEAVLKRHPLVQAAVVIPWQDQSASKELVAYVVLNHEQAGWQQDLLKCIAERLPEYMVPAAFVALPVLPLTPNGKLDRRALPVPKISIAEQSAQYIPPRDLDEELVCGIFAGVLKRERVGINWNFFELGGHSLLATQVISRIRKELAVDLPLRGLFEFPTVAGLAGEIRAARAVSRPLAPPISPVDRERGLPLSFAQQRLWFLDRLQPGNTAYNMLFGIRLTGTLDTAALQRSLDEIVRRHEILRTTFPEQQGVAAQKIEDKRELQIEEDDLRSVPQQAREDEVLRRRRAEAEKPFDLQHGPLLRVKLLRLDEQESVLLATMHHIVSDGWSIDILVREFSRLYTAYALGQKSPLPELEIQYADFTVWQRAWLQGNVLERQVEYWRKQLANIRPVDLPADRPRPAVIARRDAAMISVNLNSALVGQLNKLGRREGVTLFMTLLAAWQLLLSRYSGQRDIPIGTPIAGRTREETSGLIGFFVNTLVLRTRIHPTLSFRELLNQVRELTLEAYEHQDVPFEKLVDELQPERDLSRQPFFQVMFGLQNTAQEQLQLPQLQLRVLDREDDLVAAKFDLNLLMAQTGDGIHGRLEYVSGLFDKTTVETMIQRWKMVLEQVVTDAAQPVAQISLISETERELLASGWSGAAVAHPEQQSLGALVAHYARQRPQASALVAEGRELSYAQLNREANQWAHFLMRQGVQVGERVGMCLEQAADVLVVTLGVLKRGAVVVGLEAEEPGQRLQKIIESSRAGVVIAGKAVGEKLAGSKVRLLYVEEVRVEVRKEREEEPELEVEIGGESVACVLYRSSGNGPIGILLPQRVLSAGAFVEGRGENELRMGGSERVAQRVGFGREAESLELFRVLAGGGCVINVSARIPLTPRKLADLLRQQRVTVLWTSAAMLERMAREFPWALKSVRQIVCEERGAVLSWLQQVLQAEVLERVYSTHAHSEVGGRWMTYPLASLAGQRISGFNPEYFAAGTKMWLLDSYLEPVPDGVLGEIYAGGELLAAGYSDEARLTAGAWVPDALSGVRGGRLYRTGDWAWRRGDGSLEYRGREDGRGLLDGIRVEAEEIEAILAEHPGVQEAAVVMREVPGQHHSSLVALLVKAEGQTVIEEESLNLLLRRKLREEVVPKSLMVVEKIARVVDGGVDRGAALQMAQVKDAASAAPEYEEPRTEVEKILSEVWKEVLKVKRVGVYDNFFKLGGDSILSIQVIARARQAGVGLVPRQIFEKQTIAELAVVAGKVSVEVEADQGVVSGMVPLTPFQRVFFEWELARPEYFNQSVMLGLDRKAETGLLEEAVKGLLEQHDALRMRYERSAEGAEGVRGAAGWRQICEAEAPGGVYERVDLAGMEEREQRKELERDMNRVQSSLDPVAGRLVKAVEYELGEKRGRRLLLVIHHLVVDGVSWRILVEDLERGYGQRRAGKEVRLGTKTTSFKQWAERLQEYGGEERVRKELHYWTSETGSRPAPLPLDYQNNYEQNLFSTQGNVIVRLDEEETRALLQDVPGVYNTQMNDVLLTALARVLGEWSGSESVLVELEAHGREEIFEDVDLSRTVGWFTSTYPVLLEINRDRAWEPSEALGTVKEQLRGIPNRGLGYGVLRYITEDEQIRQRLKAIPQAEIIFNYLGQTDQVFRGSRLFKPCEENCGAAIAGVNRRPYLLDVNAIIAQGKLQVSWGFSGKLHRQETIEGIANRYMECLRELMTHCRSEEAGGFTPSDFPADQMTQDDLMQIAELLDRGSV